MGLKRIPLDQIVSNPEQPRKLFDEQALRELAGSILARGLKQPIAVRPMGDDTYQIIFGERRWRAHCLLRDEGKLEEPTILANIRKATDEEMAVDAIIENLARADISPMEEAGAFQRMLDLGYSVGQLAREIGVQTWRVKYRLQLIALDPTIQTMLAKGQISSPVAHEIGRLPNHTDQLRVVKLVSAGSLTNDKQVRAAVEAIRKGETQDGMFGDLPPTPTADELATVSAMEARIDRVLSAVAGGWRDGECVVAKKVSPDRAALVAEKCAALRLTLKKMEDQLRAAAVTGTLALQTAA
jgi:ParB family transcriptional regulator, chromosome partitioning protein